MLLDPDDLIRAERRVAARLLEIVTRLGDCPAAWELAALAAQLTTNANAAEADAMEQRKPEPIGAILPRVLDRIEVHWHFAAAATGSK